MHRVAKFSGWRQKGRKYHNVPKDAAGGHYHSTFEAKVGGDLLIRQKAGELVEIKRQAKVELYAYGKHICDYWVDFLVFHADGTKEYIEAKGFATREWKFKWSLFEAQMAETEPHTKLTIIKN